MKRVVVAGITGSGKSTLARALAQALSLPFVELDGFVEGPGWTELPDVARRVTEMAAGDAWVTDNLWYPEVQGPLLARADTVVWLDLPRRVVLPRLVRRTLRRGLPPRPALVNGNRERLWAVVLPSSPLQTALWQHRAHRERMAGLLADVGAEVVRLRTPGDVDTWLSKYQR